jgi:hypothetical protein
MPINRVSGRASESTGHTPSARGERSVYVEDQLVVLPDGSEVALRLMAQAGAIGLEESTGGTNREFVELRRVRTLRYQDRSDLYCWYSQHRLPHAYGGKTAMVRLHGNSADAARKFNRTEHVRPIPPSDPDFKRLYGGRTPESINRGLEDTLYLNRAHSVGHARQHVNLLGYALMVNSLALHEHRQRQRLAPAA